MLAGGAAVVLGSATAGCSDVISSLGDGPGSVTDWPMFQFDAANTGFTPDRGPTDEVAVRWSVDTEDLTFSRTPAVVGNTMFVGGTKRLYALAAETGEERWQVSLARRTAPAVIDGMLYTSSHNSDDGWRFGALDTETGEERWQVEMDAPAHGSSPTVVDGIVYVCDHGLPGVAGGTVYALSAETGEEEWRYQLAATITSTQAVADETVYIGDWRGGDETVNTFVALDAGTGEERWSVKLESSGLTGSPAAAGGTVYLADGNGWVRALDAGTGEERWSNPPDRFLPGSPAVAGGTVFVPSARLRAYDATTGEEQWVNENVKVQSAELALTEDSVYLTGHGGRVHVLDAGTGEERWQFEVADLPERHGLGAGGTPPVVSGGVVYVAGIKGTIYALEEA